MQPSSELDPYQVVYEAIVKTPIRTGMRKVKRADLDAQIAVDALRRADLLSTETHLRVMTRGHVGNLRRETCPACGETGLGRIALVKVAFTFEPCRCAAAPYTHLVEQLWHRGHVGAPPEES